MTSTHPYPPAQSPVAEHAEPTPPRVAASGPNTTAGQGNILAIDPGSIDSGYTIIDRDTRRPLWTGKIHNPRMLDRLYAAIVADDVDTVVIEMVASYGMPVGREVFETCVWIGRFQQEAMGVLIAQGLPFDLRLVYRQPIKLHHCGSARAKDSNITQALVDRFTPGHPNRGKGTKANPGWFYGFKADVWQAYALAVYVADTTPVSAPGHPRAAAGADAAATTQEPPDPVVAAAPPTEQGALL